MSCCSSDCCQWFLEFVLREQIREEDGFYDAEEEPLKKRPPPAGEEEPPFLTERMRQLFNRHGFNLAVFPGGHVKGG